MAQVLQTGLVTRKTSSFQGIAKDEVTLAWKIEHFQEVVEVAIARGTFFLGEIRFFVGNGNGMVPAVESQLSSSLYVGVPLVFKLVLENIKQDEITVSVVRLHLSLESNVRNPEGLLLDVLSLSSGKIVVGSRTTRSFKCACLRKLTAGIPSGWNLFDMSHILEHLDEEGSLNFKLQVTAYTTAGTNSLLVGDSSETTNACTIDNCKEELLKEFGSLLGDEKTSDVKISVIESNKVAGTFQCHTLLLSARSPVFRAMFESKDMVENVEKLVTVEDISVEVMDQFLHFVYTGRLKDKRKEGTSDPVWVKLLPELVYAADKYILAGLKRFCEANFHRAVNEENAAEMFILARRHQLLKAEAKLRSDFSKNIDTLLNSLLK